MDGAGVLHLNLMFNGEDGMLSVELGIRNHQDRGKVVIGLLGIE